MFFKTSPRGTWLPYEKEPMASLPLLRPDHIRQVVLPITSENGLSCKMIVEKGDVVAVGQLIAIPLEENGISIYSTVAGVIGDTYTAFHPLMGETTYVIIECMTMEEAEKETPRDAETLNSDELLAIVREYGIIDELDGQILADKLEAMIAQYPTTLVANAIEDQVYACSAWTVLREDHAQVIAGLRIASKIIGAAEQRIAVSLSKEHLAELKQHISDDNLYVFDTDFYPHSELETMELSAFCIGVQACRALYRAVAYREPQTEGILTVAGDMASLPINMVVPFGTSLRLVLEVCGMSDLTSKIILGDNMTGISIDSIDIPIIPGMTCVLGLSDSSVSEATTCINCGRCERVCHKHLLPFEIARRYENMQYRQLASLHPTDCDGCNACTYICPAKRNVSDMVLQAAKEAGVVLFDWGPHHDE